ncbi:MAG: hypothetical protein ACLRWQ_18215 [Flavonifractor plautii]
MALGGPARRDELLERYADLAAIGTVADVMSLTGENRTIVRLGLEALRRTGRPGLQALLHEAGLDERPLTATAIGYTLAPRINAAGRMGCAGSGRGTAAHRRSRPGRGAGPGPCASSTGSGRPLRQSIYQPSASAMDRGPAAGQARPGPGRASTGTRGGGHRGLPPGGEVLLPGVYDLPDRTAVGKGSCRSFGGLQPVCRPGVAAPTCWRASAATPWRRASPSGRRTSPALPGRA